MCATCPSVCARVCLCACLCRARVWVRVCVCARARVGAVRDSSETALELAPPNSGCSINDCKRQNKTTMPHSPRDSPQSATRGHNQHSTVRVIRAQSSARHRRCDAPTRVRPAVHRMLCPLNRPDYTRSCGACDRSVHTVSCAASALWAPTCKLGADLIARIGCAFGGGVSIASAARADCST